MKSELLLNHISNRSTIFTDFVFLSLSAVSSLFFIGQSKHDASSTKKQESLEEIFLELNAKPTSAARRLTLLNGLVKIVNTPSRDDLNAYTTEEILIR